MADTMTIEVKTTGQKVRIARASKDWTQKGLAAIARTNQMTISRIEHDFPVDENEVQKVLKALEINE